MFWPKPDPLDAVIPLGFAAWAAWRGYRRRRGHWSIRSWLGFGCGLLFGSGFIAFSFAFLVALGNHAEWTGARGSTTRATWSLVVVACLGIGTVVNTLLLAWFAQGDPSQAFPPLGRAGTVKVPIGERARAFLTAYEDD